MTDLINHSAASSTLMRKVIILQGLPGAGKSTYTKKLADQAAKLEQTFKVCSADAFYYKRGGGKYTYIPALIGECFRDYIAAVTSGVNLIVVDNTNLSVAEIAPYMLGGTAFGYEVEIVRLECDPTVALTRNIHEVPPHVVAMMANDIKTLVLPPWWKLTTLEPGSW